MRDDWMKGYPSVIITRSYVGNREYANLFYGEGTKLLYQLKNQMKFRDLGQLKMPRRFTDGTVIIASSIFGHDQIIIDVSQSNFTLWGGVEVSSCVITLIDFPTIVQPMWYPGEIRDDEIFDIDYIETYYTIDVSQCSVCNPEPIWNFSFEFTEPTGYQYSDAPNDHLIYSLDGLGYGEVIEKGEDGTEHYVRWKVYTEGVDLSRTGYGFIKVIVSIVNKNTGETICSVEKVVEVDCCQKDVSNRETIMWWGYCVAPNAVCPVDEGWIHSSALNYFGLGDKYIPLFAFPQKSGSCIPYSWTNLGDVGTLTVSEDTLSATLEIAGEIACDNQVIVSLTDRCGTDDVLKIESCCDDTEGPDLGYTSLQMGCGGYQTLMATGGCGPYSWSVSGGGTITPVEPGSAWAGYQAPDENPNCENNATVTVTDCCRRSSSISIATNCYGVYPALKYCLWYFCVSPYACNDDLSWCWEGQYHIQAYLCDGTGTGWTGGEPGQYCYGYYCDLLDSNCTYAGYSYPGICNNPYGPCPDPGQSAKVCDERTDETKAQGCCPINPMTGLPAT